MRQPNITCNFQKRPNIAIIIIIIYLLSTDMAALTDKHKTREN
jgi:hypothetical protein